MKFALLEFGADLGEDFIVVPGGGGVGFLVVVGSQDEVAGGEEDFLDFRVLADFLAGGGDDELIVLAGLGGAVFHAAAFEGDPSDAHGFHIAVGEVAGVFGVEGGELGDFCAGEGPGEAGELGARVGGVLGVFHHLPKAFEAGVAVAVEGEGCGGEVGEDAEFVALGEDDFAGTGGLGKDFPRGCAVGGNGCPPVRGVIGARGR